MQTLKQDSTRSARATSSISSPSSISSSPATSGSSALRQNAFSAHFLETVRRRSEAVELAESPLAVAAHAAGPWEVERVPAGDGMVYAVARRGEPARDGGGARLAFVRRQEALLGAAALSALAVPDRLSLNMDRRSGRRSHLGHPLHDGTQHLGHASPALVAELAALATLPRGSGRPGGPFLAYFHAYRTLASVPDAAALLVEALDTETLNLLGRATMRRLARSLSVRFAGVPTNGPACRGPVARGGSAKATRTWCPSLSVFLASLRRPRQDASESEQGVPDPVAPRSHQWRLGSWYPSSHASPAVREWQSDSKPVHERQARLWQLLLTQTPSEDPRGDRWNPPIFLQKAHGHSYSRPQPAAPRGEVAEEDPT